MTNEIIDLLPSEDLKAKIRETAHCFTERELIEIICLYAPTVNVRLGMLERFSRTASPDASVLAMAYVEYERETFARFSEASDGYVYALDIRLTPDSSEECFICASYQAALTCIDRFLAEYAEYGFKETELTRYGIRKERVFSEHGRFCDDAPKECVLGPHKEPLTVFDPQRSFEDLCAERGIPVSDEEVRYPCFVPNRALVKYRDGGERTHFGICLCWVGKDKCDGLIDFYYVVPLDSPTVREHRFDGDDHDHIAAPKVTLASPEELDARALKNYDHYLAFLDAGL